MDQRKNNIPKAAPASAMSSEPYINASCGLSRKEARSRYRAIGRNTLFDGNTARKRRLWLNVLRDPSLLFSLFVLFLAVLFAPMSVWLLALVGLVGVLAYPLWIQRLRSRNEAVFAVFRMPRVCVIRDGIKSLARADQIVLGDLISLKAGDVVPADCRMIAADRLRVLDVRLDDDGTPLRRLVSKRALPRELVGRSDDFNSAEDLLRGMSEILEGEALAVVIATGEDTCWRQETRGCEELPEYHSAGWDSGCVGRAAERALMYGTLIGFIAFFLFLVVRVFVFSTDEAGFIGDMLSLGALVGVGAGSLLLSLLACFECKWQNTRISASNPHERAIIKSNQAADRLVGLTDLFVTGKEALALLQAEPTSSCHLSALQKACAEKGIRLTIFLDESDVTPTALQMLAPDRTLKRADIEGEEHVVLTKYAEKYRVFCGFQQDSIVKLMLSLRLQKRRVAVISGRTKDYELLALSSLAVGIDNFFAMTSKNRTDAREGQADVECQAPAILLRRADLLIAPTDRIGSSVATLLSLRDDAVQLLSRGRAATLFLALSQLSALFFVGFTALMGLALPTAFSVFYGVGCTETVGLLWLSSGVTAAHIHPRMGLSHKRLMRELKTSCFWAPLATSSLLCVAAVLVLRLLGEVTPNEAAVFLFCSLLFVQPCGLLLAVLRSGMEISLKRFLLPLVAMLLPVVILSTFSVAFDGLNRLLLLGNWSPATLCLLPLAPVCYFVTAYLSVCFFHRTAK